MIPSIIVAIVSFIFFIWNLSISFAYGPDFGRDSLAVWNILQGDITLLGPKTSFGGLYTGPYYFYFLVPFLKLFNFHPFGIAFGNALLAAICCGAIFYLLYKKTSIWFASLSSIWIILTPYLLYSGRGASNALSYLTPLFLYLVVLVFYYPFKLRSFWFAFFGLAAGVIANIHPAALIVIVPFTTAIFIYRRDKNFIKNSFMYIAGFITSFLPLIFFEISHNFIMIRNTFVDRSYEMFINKQNAVVNAQTSTNIFKNLFFIDQTTSTWIHPTFIQLFVVVVGLAILLYKRKNIILVLTFFLFNTLIYSALFRFQAVDYYVFPLLILTQVIFLYFLSLTEKIIQYGLLVVFIIIGLISFPVKFYSPTSYSYDVMYKHTQSAVKMLPLEHTDFNLVVISGTPSAIVGNEYRYPLQLLGYKADSIFDYAKSRQLLMISNRSDLDKVGEKSWEIDQFGEKELIKKVKVDDTYWYLFKKTF